MLLRENSDIYHCLKLLVLLRNAHVSKLVAISVGKYFMALTEIQSKICRLHGSLSQKGSQPLHYLILNVQNADINSQLQNELTDMHVDLEAQSLLQRKNLCDSAM